MLLLACRLSRPQVLRCTALPWLQGCNDGEGDATAAAAGEATGAVYKAQVGKPAEEDLQSWGHHGSVHSVPDTVMQQVPAEHVSFIFSCQASGDTKKALGAARGGPGSAVGCARQGSSSSCLHLLR